MMFQKIWQQKKLLSIVGGAIGTILLLLIVTRLNYPSPRTSMALIYSGRISRTIINDDEVKGHTGRGRTNLPRLPHHIEFSSQGGPIDVYVLDFSSGDPQRQVVRMTKASEQIQAGQRPDQYFASASGVEGRIDLNSWPIGWAKYCVIMYAPQQDAEVTLTTHYGP